MTNVKRHWLRGEPYFGSGSTLLVACVTIALSYLVPHLVGTMTSNPETVWPLWPGSAILVTGLLLVRADVWPLVIPASFVGFAVADLQTGVPLSSITRFIPGNTVEVLISAVGLRYCFDGVPKLNSVRTFAKYSLFAIILGPLAGAFFSAHGVTRDYWTGWKIVFLSEVLAFITVTPALLSWISEGRALMRRSRVYHIEGVALIVGLVLVSYIVFTVREDSRSPALFYTLVPFLLWSALRFGWLGVSTSLIAVTSLSIWGAVYGRGPFSNMVPLTDPLPLQMFLVFASIPFMVLAALAEEHEHAAHVVHESEERLRLAQSAAHVGTFDWNLRTGVNTWTPETEALFGLPPGGFGGTLTAFEDLIHPDDRERIRELIQEMIRTGQDPAEDAEYRVVWPDGSVHWIAGRGRLVRDESDELSRMIGVNVDITSRKLAEQELAITAERLHLAIEAGSVGGWDFDLKTGRNVWFGKSHAQLGMTPDETVGSSEEFWERVHEDDRDDLRNAMRLARVRHEEFIHDFRVVRRDGKAHWLRSRGRYQYTANGEPERLLGLSIDITESKEAEQALSRHSAIVESSDDAISSVTLDGVIVTWNAGAERMYGYTENEAVGKSASIIVPLELRDQQKKILETLWAGGRIEQLETVRVSKTGKRIDVSLSISPIKDSTGKIVGCAGIARDITQRKRAEEALLGSEQRYRLLFERNVAGVGIASLDGRVLDCNDGWARILGYESRGELLGRHASEFYFNPHDRQPLVDELRDGQQVFSRESQLKRKDGSPVWVLFNAAALKAEHNVPIVQTTMIDISEWKGSELALADMTRKLIEAQEQERARIGRELHDDINQRLALLSLELEQLQENPSQIENRLQEFRRRIGELSNDVQALSHDLHSSKLEYLGVVAGMKSWCKEFAERHKMQIDFRSDVPGAVPLQVGLPLFRVIQEALQNVVKHSGVRRVEVELCEDASEIHLLISDSGHGFNVEAALQGTGLGLTSMRERIRLLNGTIAIESKPMTGTRIHVRVPLQSKQEARAAG